MNLLVVLGAGASYDAFPTEHGAILDSLRLPLANNIFGNAPQQNAQKMIYPVASVESRVNRARRANADNFDLEAVLYEILLESESETRYNLAEQLFTSRFYVRAVMQALTTSVLAGTRNLTTYVELLQVLDDWQNAGKHKTSIVTFNYDNLIEEALRQQYGWRYPTENTSDFSSYYIKARVPLFKVHGSVNWWREGISSNDENVSYTFDACSTSYSSVIPGSFDDYYFGNPSLVGKPNMLYMPSIALPFKEKTAFDDCPPEIIDAMRANIKKTDAILVIGWKAADAHFIEELKTSTHIKKIYVVNKSWESGNIALEHLAGLSNNFQRIDKGFADFVSSNEIDSVLKDAEQSMAFL
jgi:hypothetical protein